jgi:5-methylcytosine-specific restriction endonuclease McrA
MIGSHLYNSQSKGGPTTFDNLQTLCRSCNSSKGARWTEVEG